MPLTTQPDVGRHREPAPETQMSTTETGSGNNFGTESDGDAILKATPTFSIMPDLEMALLALKSRGFLFLFRNYFYFRFWSPPMSIDTARCRAMLAMPDLGRAW